MFDENCVALEQRTARQSIEVIEKKLLQQKFIEVIRWLRTVQQILRFA